jgi:hypothetical protein
MDEHQEPVASATTPRGSRRREWTAGALALALTALTAGVALWVNVDAANPDVPSQAGTADRVDLISEVGQPDPQASTPASATGTGAITTRPSAEPDSHDWDSHDEDSHDGDSHERESHERESHERDEGHDDDD